MFYDRRALLLDGKKERVDWLVALCHSSAPKSIVGILAILSSVPRKASRGESDEPSQKRTFFMIHAKMTRELKDPLIIQIGIRPAESKVSEIPIRITF